MNFCKTPHSELPSLPITPMVDVIFTLLAFFLLATQLIVAERDFGMGYRSATSGPQAISPRDLPKSVPVYVRGTPIGVSVTVGQAQLPDNNLAALQAKLDEINLPDLEVAVYADPDLTVDQVACVLDAVLASPMKKMSVSRLVVVPAGPASSDAGLAIRR
jgi:biopolymer transport protein ExbD